MTILDFRTNNLKSEKNKHKETDKDKAFEGRFWEELGSPVRLKNLVGYVDLMPQQCGSPFVCLNYFQKIVA